MANPTTNFGWVMPTSTDLVTDLPADFAVFGQAVDTSMADLKGGTTGQILAKATNTDMDFTWVTNDVGDITAVTAGTGISGGGTSGAVTITNSMATEITASGDIIVGTGSGTFDNLPIGTTGQVLTADTTVSPYKVKWSAPSSGAMVLVKARTTFSAVSDTSTTFDSVFTSTYKNYIVIIDYINGSVGGGGSTLNMVFRYGSVSQASYAGNTNQVNYGGTVTNIGGTSAAAIGLGQLYLDQSLFTITMGGMGVASSVGQLTHYGMVSALAGSANGGWYSNNSRTYDGFQLSASSGTITGAVTIYGLVTS